ncbi:Pancreatic triacylglycerol lipase [Cyphomyrmex costatus]|uniref:phospholipase A1 n=1 Tax=Cyphomyrmex costatus TaxID=456900 RepID=A0A195CPI2_9HYME|nr:Pancreatic triacylglycerol lipase [Cyphomyrmex costatus]
MKRRSRELTYIHPPNPPLMIKDPRLLAAPWTYGATTTATTASPAAAAAVASPRAVSSTLLRRIAPWGNQTDLDFATGVNLIYYKCNSEIPATIAYPITVPQTLLNVLDTNKRVIFYIYGYLQYPEDSNVQLMMEALCYERTDNIVLLDWSKYSNGSYASVFRDAEKVGSLFARSLQLLVESGLDVSKIYIIGHSLGAHIAGYAGKCNAFKIPRITGLDPANPLFYLPGCYLTSKDAEWLDVIHTDKGGYGTPTSMGTADYYVNGGTRPQPGCQFLGVPLSNDGNN